MMDRINFKCNFGCVFVTIVSGLMVFVGGNDDNNYYLVTKDKSCLIGTNIGKPLDLVCQHYDRGPPDAKPKLCTLRSIQWQKVGVASVLNISDSNKFGVWETLPGWGMSEQEHISLLRVRDLGVRDMGAYQCRVTCEDRRGRLQQNLYFVDVCLKEGHSQHTVCSPNTPKTFCTDSFRDGVCDLDCSDERHLFDGFDCAEKLPTCPERYPGYCAGRFGNEICDESCNNEPCFWDGGDCVTKSIKFADDTLVLYLSDFSSSITNAIDFKELGRSLSKLLRTVVRILPDDVENDLAEYQAARTSSRSNKKRSSSDTIDTFQPNNDRSSRLTRDTNSYHETTQKLRIKIDNTNCKGRCFKKATKAAQFIYLSLKKGWDPGIPLAAIGVLTRDNSRCELENNTLLHIDLSGLDRSPKSGNNPNFWQSLTDWTFDTWMIVAIISGAICVLVVIVTVTVIVYHLTSSAKLRKRRLEQARIMYGEKLHLRATDV